MDATDLLLATAFRHVVDEANAEAALDALHHLTGTPLAADAFHAAVAACVRAGWIEEPVRIEDGALHCHWRLRLTPAGVAEARRRSGDIVQ
jgi:hypothetical protein